MVWGLLWSFSGLGFSQTNLLTNPGFENCDSAGWSSWGCSQAQFFATWKHMYDRIRSADSNAIILGPSISSFVANNEEGGWLKAFLIYAQANNCLPNILSWHEMVWDKHIPGQAQIMRDFMAANGIADRPY